MSKVGTWLNPIQRLSDRFEEWIDERINPIILQDIRYYASNRLFICICALLGHRWLLKLLCHQWRISGGLPNPVWDGNRLDDAHCASTSAVFFFKSVVA